MKDLYIIDSGMGGLIIAEKIITEGIKRKIHLIIDAPSFPYGKKSFPYIAKKYYSFINTLKGDIIFACGTLSSVHIFKKETIKPYKIIDAVTACVKQFKKTDTKIGVLSTKLTANSKSFHQNSVKGRKIISIADNDVLKAITAIQKGDYAKAVRHIVKIKIKYEKKGITTYVLGCTHLLAIKNSIDHIFYPARIISPIPYMLEQLG